MKEIFNLPAAKSFMAVAVLIVLAPFLSGAETAPQKDFNAHAPLDWSVRMANSEMARLGDKLDWKQNAPAKWDYTAGLFTLSLLKLDSAVHDPRYVKFSQEAIGSFITPDGDIHGYKPQDYSLDNINAGKTVLALYELTGEARYKKAAERLRKQLAEQPRTASGGFWHKKRYPNQMWLDGIYMAEPFYARYAKLFDEPSDFDDIAKQILLAGEHTYSPETGLFYHGWDESHKQAWANPLTGTSLNFWCRAMGWYGMAMVDVLDYFPANHPARPQIISMLKKLCDGIVKYQDPASGLWYQVVDQGGRKGNYLEATASSMFVYTLAKGVNQGYLPRDFMPAILKGYSGIVNRLIKVADDGKVSLTQCCSVAGLGYGRDGSFDYYIKEPVVENDLKGVGPFILAGIQVQKLAGLPITVPAAARELASDDPPTDPPGDSTIAPAWSQVPQILSRIQAPVFPDRDFPITQFGAPTDGKTDCSEAIRKAIDACAGAGGGRVVVPAGEYVTGPIHLKSNVNLHLDGGATLKFTTNPDAYLPAVYSQFEGMELYNYSPLIYSFKQTNIAVTGDGTLDGQASDQNWWEWKGKRNVRPGEPDQKAARDGLVKMVDQGVPVAERRFGKGDFLRPNFFEPYRCRNVMIEGVRVRRSPMWEINPMLCTNVIVRGLDILSHGPNNDGCDPECCKDVLIENCTFDTGDDCIAIKSGRNNEGRRLGVASEDIIVRDCTMKDGHGGVVIGSEISGGCSNVFAENCQMHSPHLQRVLRLKSNAVRGGVIQNVFVRNMNVGQVSDAALQIDFLYEEGANGPYKPVARNIVMQDIRVKKTPRVLNVVGFPSAEISNVRIYDSTFLHVAKPDVVKDADVKLVNCQVDRTK